VFLRPGVLLLDAVEVGVRPDFLEHHLKALCHQGFKLPDGGHATGLGQPAVDASPAVAQDRLDRVAGTGQAEISGEFGDFSGVFQSAHSSSRNSFTASWNLLQSTESNTSFFLALRWARICCCISSSIRVCLKESPSSAANRAREAGIGTSACLSWLA